MKGKVPEDVKPFYERFNTEDPNNPSDEAAKKASEEEGAAKKKAKANKKELKSRLVQRNQDKPEVIKERLKAYDDDIFHWSDYDYVIINDNLDHCFKQIEKIIIEEKKN